MNENPTKNPKSKHPKNQVSKNPENPKKNSKSRKALSPRSIKTYPFKKSKSEQIQSYEQAVNLKFVPIDGRENVGKVSYKNVETS